ncbi:hypothetical protein SEA_WESAK_26 [Microbacterium phage Wesak]|uniref:Uncharacterized protein n=1 Tax=Microbacterium phage Wesak TaxID=2653751 RepID=A0A5Q2WLN4_9CAUD|nr:hypothetical protein SEA_WESAK_26 [Microbacterium phage Wesak]
MFGISEVVSFAVLMSMLTLLGSGFLFYHKGARDQYKLDSEIIEHYESRAEQLLEDNHILQANGGRIPAPLQLFPYDQDKDNV